MSELEQAQVIVGALRGALDRAVAGLLPEVTEAGRVSVDRLDAHQVLAYDLAALASRLAAAEQLLDYGAHGEREARLALAFTADLAADVWARSAGRGLDLGGWWQEEVAAATAAGRAPAFLDALGADIIADGGEAGPRHLSEEREMVRQTFRRFADERVAPIAEDIHRHDRDIPEELIRGLAEMGCFALSIPTAYGGFAEGKEDDLIDMVVVTEELSRASLGAAGSLITRPEIISTAILRGGTEEQKRRWLPQIASGERMCAVAVTEPDHGSDVAGITTTARRDGDTWVIDGLKTWCTFAGRAELLLVLARTGPGAGHRGLSLFVVEKPAFPGHAFEVEGPLGGTLTGRAIPTIGYRGMHSFELRFDGWRVPADALIGGEEGLGKGFYLQMQAFAAGRLQTAARAQGLMQAALEAACTYTSQRRVFGRALASYELTRAKIARMGALLVASRTAAFDAARRLAAGDGQLEASQVKQMSCLAAEWVTREAQQLHGGYGYAEEYPVSRYFVDARVLSIFEGADEVLALRVIARTLLQRALNGR